MVNDKVQVNGYKFNVKQHALLQLIKNLKSTLMWNTLSILRQLYYIAGTLHELLRRRRSIECLTHNQQQQSKKDQIQKKPANKVYK